MGGLRSTIINEVEDFNSPEHLVPLVQLYPSYDYADIETRGLSGIVSVQAGKGAGHMFTPPAWLDLYVARAVQPDAGNLSVSTGVGSAKEGTASSGNEP